MGHIAEVVSCAALARPDVQFRLIHNQKEVKNWPAVRRPLDRIIDVLGDDLQSSLYPFDYKDNYLSLSGWTSDPAVTRSTSQKIYIFVNGRLIRDRGVQYAIFEGYRGRIMKGRFPVAVLFIDLSPDQVDVNVHPTKHEVRFARQKQVYEAVKTGVLNIWKSKAPAKARWDDVTQTAQELEETRPEAFQMPARDMDAGAGMRPDMLHSGVRASEPEIKQTPFQPTIADLTTLSDDEIAEARAISALSAKQPESPSTAPPARQGHLWERKKFSHATVIGQFSNTYILCEKDGALIIVDQHAAHERIAYERLKNAAAAAKHPPTQKLMLPETFDLGYRETAIIEEMLDDLNALGLEIDHFGGNTFVVKSVPVLIADREIKPLIADIAEAMDAYGYSPGLADALDQCIILMACHGSIRARQALTVTEMRELLMQLDVCNDPFHCPHGRPTFVEWPLKALEKSFKRIL
jgi:DNA mismatch repair protein MutL